MTAAALVPAYGHEALLCHSLLGRPLGDHARLALAEAGIDEYSTWQEAVSTGLPVVVHDPLCPLLPAAFLVELVAGLGDVVLVGVQPVTDTVKTVEGDVVGGTLDRERYWSLASPLVVPPALAATVDPVEVGNLVDLRGFVSLLGTVEYVEVPGSGRRVTDESDVVLLEAAHDV